MGEFAGERRTCVTGVAEIGPVERIAARSICLSGVEPVIVCDHARNRVPPELDDLGIAPADMARHIAYDIGAREVAVGLAAGLGCAAVLSTVSRLVIDPNRGEDDPTLVMRLYDGTVIEGNRRVDAGETERRLDAYYRPYHAAIEAELDRVLAAGRLPALISIHSFTPQLKGRPWRPWHLGLLWDRDDRLLRPLASRLEAEPDLVVGENEPYTGQLTGDCMWRHGTMRGLPHVLVEIRNDLIAHPEGQANWAERLTPVFAAALEELAGTVGATPDPSMQAS
ncbi:MAG: N-formylglutamate amidohydrolase [Pikeienuella sp.]